MPLLRSSPSHSLTNPPAPPRYVKANREKGRLDAAIASLDHRMDDLRSQRKVVEDRLAARTESHDQVSHELDRCVAAREGLTGDCRDWRNSSVRNQKKSFERYVERARCCCCC